MFADVTASLVCQPTQVTVIGAGKVGSTLAQRIAEKNLAHVVLLDVVEGLPQGIALDLMEARGVERHDRHIVGTNSYADTAGSQIVVITAGRPRQPGMSRDDLLKVNANIVAQAARQAIAHSPDAVLMVITNPLDVMTYVAWQVSGLPARRVIGMAGVLDAARFQTFIALELNVSIADVNAMVLGSHGDSMVPLPRFSTVNGIPITELMDSATIDRLVERTRNGGTEIVKLMQTGGAYYAPASAAARMVEAILQNQMRLLPAAAHLQGEYQLQDLFLGVPCRLGCRGVESILELHLSDRELQGLHESAQRVRDSIQQAIALLQASSDLLPS
ncbi:malate dehydrogenase [Geitlerinema sp. PCC 7407]|uniref:malate dehydrogenase n=1 Tax=Geitlerinema sp. PCC 7407 TaxID=1173025 RepID=UPI00029FDEB5|nr:malate dehydrogenase [Geitlerinema sp. PCC 7407]AFY67847.1 malate dehydrogenase (NAD) [Geitlerinema sp. PCC 7407]